jgi:fatty acid desaturase
MEISQTNEFNDSSEPFFNIHFLEKESNRTHITRWLLAASGDYAIIAVACLIAYFWRWPAYPFSIVLFGIAQHRLALLGHDGAHGLICRNKTLNYWLAQLLCFWPLLYDIKSYRKFHWDHHRHTGEDNLDPEIELKHNLYHLPKSQLQLYTRFFLDLFGFSIPEFLRVTVYFAKRSNPIWAFSFLLISFALSYYIGHLEFFFLFLISKPTSFWAVFRLRIYSEHVDIPGTHRIHVSLWQRLLFAPHNTWMHWEHHKHPQVPFWQLPVLRSQYKNEPIINFEELLRKQRADSDNP